MVDRSGGSQAVICRNSATHALLSLMVVSLTLCARAENPKPRTIVDFYLLLPSRYFEVAQNSKERMRWAKNPHSVIDIKNGYLSMQGDGAQQSVTVCLFKCPDRSYVIAVGDNEHEVFDPYLDFYRYQNGKWKNVTPQILPVPWNSDLDYLLPRYGRTIHVLNKSHRKVYDLVWQDGAFHIVKSAKRTRAAS